MNVISLSIGRNILDSQSRERMRMCGYAQHLDALHMIMLTRREHGFSAVQHEGKLHLYPTNSYSRILMLVDCYRIGRRLVKNYPQESIIVSAQDPFVLGLLAWLFSLRYQTKLHVQVHGDFFGSSYIRGNRLVKVIRIYVARFVMKRACGIRVVSERIKRSLVALGVDGERITVLPIRPELERFLAVSHVVGDHDPFVFLAASRFSREKNIPLLVSAFAKIAERYPQVRLRIVGRGSEEERVRTLITSLGTADRVEIIPWTESIENEMQRADVFVTTSDHEAYGLTLIEAMAVGLPLITTDVGCVGEVVRDGEAGIVIPVRDEGALVRAMERMIVDRPFREHAHAAGRKKAFELAQVTQDDYAKEWVASIVRDEEGV